MYREIGKQESIEDAQRREKAMEERAERVDAAMMAFKITTMLALPIVIIWFGAYFNRPLTSVLTCLAAFAYTAFAIYLWAMREQWTKR